jgi:hypothetical protein
MDPGGGDPGGDPGGDGGDPAGGREDPVGGAASVGRGEPVELGEADGVPPVIGFAGVGGGSPSGSAFRDDSVVMAELRAILASDACGPGADDCSGDTQKWVAEGIRDPP